MKIKGYWHIYGINSYYSIVIDQLRILLTSGLYDRCEDISIGFIGFPEEKQLFEKYVLSQYPKLKIRYYSNNPSDYEFPTLKLIEQDKGDYVGFYFHTKAITRPFETVINHWRHFLNENVIADWQLHYENVCNGYGVSSVNYLESPDHFSGNFWWFNRKYIDRLPKIDTLDKTNRFYAEQWVCMCKNRHNFAKEFKEPGDAVFKIKYTKP